MLLACLQRRREHGTSFAQEHNECGPIAHGLEVLSSFSRVVVVRYFLVNSSTARRFVHDGGNVLYHKISNILNVSGESILPSACTES